MDKFDMQRTVNLPFLDVYFFIYSPAVMLENLKHRKKKLMFSKNFCIFLFKHLFAARKYSSFDMHCFKFF